MNKTLWKCALLALASCAALPAVAAELAPGARIRWVSIEEPNTIRIGTLRALSADTLFVSDDRDSSARPLPMAGLSQLEVSQGRPSHVGGYALIGGLSGGLTGLFMATVADAATSALAAPWGAAVETHVAYDRFFLVGAGIGAGVGALIGAGPPGPERWKAAGNVRLGLGPVGPSLCLSLRY